MHPTFPYCFFTPLIIGAHLMLNGIIRQILSKKKSLTLSFLKIKMVSEVNAIYTTFLQLM